MCVPVHEPPPQLIKGDISLAASGREREGEHVMSRVRNYFDFVLQLKLTSLYASFIFSVYHFPGNTHDLVAACGHRLWAVFNQFETDIRRIVHSDRWVPSFTLIFIFPRINRKRAPVYTASNHELLGVALNDNGLKQFNSFRGVATQNAGMKMMTQIRAESARCLLDINALCKPALY